MKRKLTFITVFMLTCFAVANLAAYKNRVLPQIKTELKIIKEEIAENQKKLSILLEKKTALQIEHGLRSFQIFLDTKECQQKVGRIR